MRCLLIVAVLLLGACTAAPEPGPRFDDEAPAQELTCMKHQPRPPGTRYTDNAIRRTGETLALLRYYTANGTKPYCDGEGPTGVDRQWADIYVEMGADRDNVTPLLGCRPPARCR
jgi:hypothetical protein